MSDPLYPRHANSGPAPEVTPRLRTVSERMVDPSQHFVWVADEAPPWRAFGRWDFTSWRAHCSCGWEGSLTSEAIAATEAASHQESSK